MQDNPVPKIAIFIGAIVVTIMAVVWGYNQYNTAATSAGTTTTNAISTVNNSGSYGSSANPTVQNGSVVSGS